MYQIDIMTLFPDTVGDMRRVGFLRKTSPPAAAGRAFQGGPVPPGNPPALRGGRKPGGRRCISCTASIS